MQPPPLSASIFFQQRAPGVARQLRGCAQLRAQRVKGGGSALQLGLAVQQALREGARLAARSVALRHAHAQLVAQGDDGRQVARGRRLRGVRRRRLLRRLWLLLLRLLRRLVLLLVLLLVLVLVLLVLLV